MSWPLVRRVVSGSGSLSVAPSDALVALRSLGYGRLIAADSVTQLPQTNGVSGSGSQSSDPLGGFSQLAILVIVLVVAVVLLRRTRVDSGRGSGSYHVIPPAVPHGLDGDNPLVCLLYTSPSPRDRTSS